MERNLQYRRDYRRDMEVEVGGIDKKITQVFFINPMSYFLPFILSMYVQLIRFQTRFTNTNNFDRAFGICNRLLNIFDLPDFSVISAHLKVTENPSGVS